MSADVLTIASVNEGKDTAQPANAEVTQIGKMSRVTMSTDQAPPAATAADANAIPEKFKGNVSELVKAYKELESKQSKGGEQPPPASATPDVAKAVTDAGFDLNTLSKEWADQGGKLSDETYTKLAEKGITKENVAEYARGQEAIAAQNTAALFEIVGGADQFKAVASWAKANLDAKEIAAYDAAIARNDIDAAKLALTGITAKFTKAHGTSPKLVKGEPAPRQDGPKPYESRAQIVAAMSDPRYKTDEAYRQAVSKRLAVSQF